MSFRKGDLLINTQQKARRYLVETLEPEAQDSFFNWNFFDSILQQKKVSRLMYLNQKQARF